MSEDPDDVTVGPETSLNARDKPQFRRIKVSFKVFVRLSDDGFVTT